MIKRLYQLSVVIIILVAILFLSMCNRCGANDIRYVWDYYHEYRFEFPFELTSSNYASQLYFNTVYSIEEMREKLAAAGYGVELFDGYGRTSVLITAHENNASYYFIIFDQNKYNCEDGYVLCNAEFSLGQPSEGMYVIIAPIHIMDSIVDDSGMVRIYCDFEYISDFYKKIKKDGILVDKVNRTITLQSKDNVSSGLLCREVLISFHQTQDANWLHFEIRSD